MTTNTIITDYPVEVVGRHTVQCANPGSLDALGSSLTFGPLDHLAANWVPVAVVYVYKVPLVPSSELLPIERLQRSLERLLDFYPHLTGRIAIDGTKGTRTITRFGTGINLLEARCNAPLNVFRSPDHDGRIVVTHLPGGGVPLLAPFDPSVEGTCRDPVLTVQHTRFACGGVALGIRLLHMVCDAEGFFQFAHDLVEIYRGIRHGGPGGLARSPHIRSHLAELCEDMAPEDRQAALTFEPSLFYAEDSGQATGSSTRAPTPAPVNPPPISGRVMRFSRGELAALKAAAADPTGTGWVSTFDAFVAHIHQRVYLARLQLPNATPEALVHDVLISTNLRSLLAADLPPAYFPNVLMTPCATLSHEETAGAPLWRVAKWMHDLVRGAAPAAVRATMGGPREVRGTARWIAAQPDKRSMRQRFQFGPGSFMASQWCKFGMYAGADFDVDASGAPVPPVLVASPFTPMQLVDGLVYLLATEEQFSHCEGQADIDLYLTLNDALWPILDADGEFRRFRQP